jgi:hypothetical protein
MVMQERYSPTGIRAREAVVFLLNSYKERDEQKASEQKEKEVEACIGEGISKADPQFNIVPAKDSRRATFPEKAYEDAPRSTEAILESISDTNIRNRLSKLGLRYVIVLDLETYNSRSRFIVPPSVIGAFVHDWKRISPGSIASSLNSSSPRRRSYRITPGFLTGWFCGMLVGRFG